MSLTALEKKKQRLSDLQNAIRDEEKKIESDLGKKLLQALKISHSEIADKEALELLVRTLVENYPKAENISDNTSSNEVKEDGKDQ